MPRTIVDKLTEMTDARNMYRSKFNEANREITRLCSQHAAEVASLEGRITALEEACREKPLITGAAVEVIAAQRQRLKFHSGPGDWHLASFLIGIAEEALDEIRAITPERSKGKLFETVQDCFDDDLKFEDDAEQKQRARRYNKQNKREQREREREMCPVL